MFLEMEWEEGTTLLSASGSKMSWRVLGLLWTQLLVEHRITTTLRKATPESCLFLCLRYGCSQELLPLHPFPHFRIFLFHFLKTAKESFFIAENVKETLQCCHISQGQMGTHTFSAARIVYKTEKPWLQNMWLRSRLFLLKYFFKKQATNQALFWGLLGLPWCEVISLPLFDTTTLSRSVYICVSVYMHTCKTCTFGWPGKVWSSEIDGLNAAVCCNYHRPAESVEPMSMFVHSGAQLGS